MAAPYNPPTKGEDLTFHVPLKSATDPNRYVANPTLASGDFKITKDDGSPVSLATSAGAPSYAIAHANDPYLVKVYINTTDMGCDNLTFKAIDQTDPPQWADLIIHIPTS